MTALRTLARVGFASRSAMPRAQVAALGLACIAAMMPHRAWAQWTVTILHPAGGAGSEGLAMSANRQAGDATVPFQNGGAAFQASVWSGSAASLVNLHPVTTPPYTSSVRGVTDTQQAGWVGLPGATHASLWTGSAASWIDLHPLATSNQSVALAISGTQQVGYVNTPGGSHASLWNGSAASWVDLDPTPPGQAGGSIASATNGVQQAGHTMSGGSSQSAALWSGTAASYVNLGAGLASSSVAGMSDTRQVGSALVNGASHACLWAGAAASFVDLHPPAALWSRASGASGMIQVGSATFLPGEAGERASVASMWSGTAASWTNLHAFLPAGVYSGSTASAVWTDGAIVRVIGTAYEVSPNRSVAVLWTRSCSGAACPADVDCSGTLTTLDVLAFLNDWFARDPAADFDHSSAIDVPDIFDFLNAWFVGC